MVWTINLMFYVLLTTLSGTVLFFAWYGIGRLLEYLGFINVIYELLKAVLLFWYLPVSFFVLLYGNMNVDRWGGFLFLYTPAMHVVSIIFCIIWIPGVLFFLTRYLIENRKLQKMYEAAIPVDGLAWECFEQVCEDLRLRAERFEVLESYHSQSPKIVLLKKPTIVLPAMDYSNQEYRVIYVHELTHYKQRALHLKHATVIAMAIHFFNPAIWMLDRIVGYWGEYACDYEAIPLCAGWKTYFRVIITMIMDDEPQTALQANLVEKKGSLEDRIRKMKRSYKMKNKSKWMAALTVAAMMVVSMVSVSAATICAADVYVEAYDNSVVEQADGVIGTASSENLVLGSSDGLDEGVVETEDKVDYRGRSGATFSWNIPVNASHRTPFFSVTAGQNIGVAVWSTPSNATIHAGIIKPDGSRLYVTGSGNFLYTFTAETTGSYSVYVQNMSSSALTVDGSYIIQ